MGTDGWGITVIALFVLIVAATLYAAYWVVRRAVAHGIRDARRAQAREAERATPP